MRWQWTLVCGLSLLPSRAADLRAESPATQPTALDQHWTANGPVLTKTTMPATRPADPDDQLPVIDAESIASVVKLSIENKMLRMTTDLPLMPEQTRIRITNFPGKTVATVTPAQDAPDDKSLASI